MVGRVWEEIEVKVPASEAWKIYGSPLLGKIVLEGLPNLFSKVEVVEGDGFVGTIVQVFLPPGTYLTLITVIIVITKHDFESGLMMITAEATMKLETGKGGSTSYKEKFTVVDDEKRVKEAEVVEGGFWIWGLHFTGSGSR
ncbi:UNVERIFIED_CONTAM: hypothetical protein Slati_4580200 [Sesamum latifolium]|uniref:Uncharacterized protein n=1 Tax=Sesamum latifolium TaxID=2727402 RepID=A0AAW2S2M0_9LAMI